MKPLGHSSDAPFYICLGLLGGTYVLLIVAMLVADRVRRATNLCHELVADLDAGEMSGSIKGVDELFDSMEQACDRLRHLLKSRHPDRYLTTRT